MKKTIVNYKLIDCTAVAVSAGDTEPQTAVLVCDTRFDSDNLSIIFGYSVSDFDFLIELENADGWSTDESDIATVIVDGHPISDFPSYNPF